MTEGRKALTCVGVIIVLLVAALVFTTPVQSAPVLLPDTAVTR